MDRGPILCAVAFLGSLDALELLVAAGVPPLSAKDIEDPVNADVLELLLLCGADPCAVVAALDELQAPALHLLLCHGAYPRANEEASALLQVCSHGKVECAELMLQAGMSGDSVEIAFFRSLSCVAVAGLRLWCAPARGPLAGFLSKGVGRRPALLRDLLADATSDRNLSLASADAPDHVADLLFLSGFPEFVGIVQSLLVEGLDADGRHSQVIRKRALATECSVRNNTDTVELLLCAGANLDGFPTTEYFSMFTQAHTRSLFSVVTPLCCALRTGDSVLLQFFSHIGELFAPYHVFFVILWAISSGSYEAATFVIENITPSEELLRRVFSEACGTMPRLVAYLDILFPRFAVTLPNILDSSQSIELEDSETLLAESGADISGLDRTAWFRRRLHPNLPPPARVDTNDTDAFISPCVLRELALSDDDD